ncbi:MAG TPA: bis-aminopropyl spermidine synthase family protein [Natronosporangium sp.]
MLESVAAAVGLQEGAPGVHRVLSAIRRLSPAPTRQVSRQTGIPVPVVAAVTNELRRRGLVTRDRPSRLTERGLALLGPDPALDLRCPGCDGGGLAIPEPLRAVADRLAALQARVPAADLALDQSHCTIATKLRRIALLLKLDLLPAESMLIVGDDDLMSLSLLAASQALGQPLVRRLAVVEISADLLGFIGEAQAELGNPGVQVDRCRHDLRDPLPDRLRGRFQTAMTDPPYTVAGARLFLSRVVEGLLPGPGRPIAFSFGPKGPDDTLAVQRAVAEIGLAVQASYRNFNEYEGSGVLGGVSHLSWLVTTTVTASAVPGHYAGPLYTAQSRVGRR